MRPLLKFSLAVLLLSPTVLTLDIRKRAPQITTKQSSPITSGGFSSIDDSSTTTSTVTVPSTVTITESHTSTSTPVNDCGYPSGVFNGWCGITSNITKTLQRRIDDGIRNATKNHCIFYPLYLNASSANLQWVLNHAANHPKLTFTVVVRPNSTVSIARLQKSHPSFVTSLEELNQHKNIRILGYIDGTASRSKAAILGEIKTYSSWSTSSSHKSSTTLDGIFFDKHITDTSTSHLTKFHTYITAIRKSQTSFNHRAIIGEGIHGLPSTKQFGLNTTFIISTAANTTDLKSALFNSSAITDLLDQFGPEQRSKLVWQLTTNSTTTKGDVKDVANLQLAFDPKMFFLTGEDGMISGNSSWWNTTIAHIQRPSLP